jgi:diguanylate cyclase (GGDEF)-like protein
MTESVATAAGIEGCVLEAINLGIIVLDSERRIVLWNSWMARYTRQSSAEVLGRDLFVLFPELAGKRVDSAVTQALRTHFPSVLAQSLHKAPFPLFADADAAVRGERMDQAVAVTPIDLADAAPHCLIQISDVSMAVNREKLLREQTMELRSQTFSDGLTGIANRRHFDIAIDKEVRRSKRAATALTLLMIDIDSFKAYNDFYGHQQGDECLIRVASTLSAMLHRPTDLIARYGGEEFAVILPDTDAQHGMHMAECMRLAISKLAMPHAKAACGQHVTVSIGVATLVSGQPTDAGALIGIADRALYHAKHGGRDRVAV